MGAAVTFGATAAAVAAAVVVADAKMTDLNVEVPFLPVPKFLKAGFVVVPISQEQDFSAIATAVAGCADH